MPSFIGSLLAGLLAVVSFARPALAQGVEEFKEWMAKAEEQYGFGEFHSKWIIYHPSGKIRHVHQLNGILAGPFGVLEQTTTHPERAASAESTSVHGSNPKYWFGLRKRADIYVLTELAPPFGCYQPWSCSFAVPYSFDTYNQILGRAETQVEKRSGVMWRGADYTEWVLNTNISHFGVEEREPRRIGLFVRPDQPGLIRGYRRYDLDNPDEWLSEIFVEYELEGGPWPLIKAVDEWKADTSEWLKDKSASYKPWRNARYDFDVWKRRPSASPCKEFTLSYYNLPEPIKTPKEKESPSGRPEDWIAPPEMTGKSHENIAAAKAAPSFLDRVLASGTWPWLAGGIGLVLIATLAVWRRTARYLAENT